jgi:hypothetical protein
MIAARTVSVAGDIRVLGAGRGVFPESFPKARPAAAPNPIPATARVKAMKRRRGSGGADGFPAAAMTYAAADPAAAAMTHRAFRRVLRLMVFIFGAAAMAGGGEPAAESSSRG